MINPVNNNISIEVETKCLDSSSPSLEPNQNFLSSPRYQLVLPDAVYSLAVSSETNILSSSFKPGDYDVVSGRGKASYNRPGNKRFRKIVLEHITEYTNAKTKFCKSVVLNAIVDKVRQQDNGTARFVKHDKKKGLWFEIGDAQAREKAGHAIREAIAAMENPSEKKTKIKAFAKKNSQLLTEQQDLFSQIMESNDVTLESLLYDSCELIPTLPIESIKSF